MIHPLLRKLATEPELFVEHASAYAELASIEALEMGQAWRRRATLVAVAAALAVVATLLAGVAALLAAALPWQQMPQPWVLIALPALLWCAAALVAWFVSLSPRPQPFGHLREQWSADAQLMSDSAPAS